MLFPRAEVSIELRVPRDEFLARSGQDVVASEWSAPFKEKLVGKVTAVPVPPAMFLFGLIMPRLGWTFGDADRQRITAALSRAAGHSN